MANQHTWIRSIPCPRCETKGRCSVDPDGTGCTCWHPDRGTWGHPGPVGDGGEQTFWRDAPENPNGSKNEPKPRKVKAVHAVATSGQLDRVYSRWLKLCPPTDTDLEQLATTRGLDADEVHRLRIGRLPSKNDQGKLLTTLEAEFDRGLLLQVPGIVERRKKLEVNAIGSGLLIPVGPAAGRPVSSLRLRLDEAPADGGRYRLLSGGDKGAKAKPEAYAVVPEGAKPGLVLVTEGEFKALAAASHFRALAVGIPGVSLWKLALPELKDTGAKEVLVAWDSDHTTKADVFRPLRACVECLQAEGYTVRLLLWDVAHKGLDDAIQAGADLEELHGDQVDQHLREVGELLGMAEEVAPVESDPLGPFAALEPDYQGYELKAALRGLANAADGLDAIDRAVLHSDLIRHLKRIKAPDASGLARSALGTAGEEEKAKESGPKIQAQEPCAEPVNGADVLDQVEKLLLRFAILPDGASVAIPLWLLHTYLIPHLNFTPRLAIQSPVKRCGKTRVIDLLRELSEKPMAAASLTAATIFRSMDAFRPTIIADEADAWMRDNEDLRGVVNTGFDRGQAFIGRCVGDSHEVKLFDTFGAMAIAGIGKLPDTVQDRSIIVSMRRKRPGEEVERMRPDVLKAAAREVKPLLARWAQDFAEEVRTSAPDLPKALNDRAADCWEPLLAIADLAGGKWPKRARQAALILSGAEAQEEEDTGVMLLADIRDIFERRRTDRVRTEALLEELASFEERPWCEWKKGQPLSPRGLAKLLRPFGVVPKPYRDGFNNVHKGYLLDTFDDAFGRYLGHSVTEMSSRKTFSSQDPPSVSVTRLQPNNHNGLSQNPIGYKPDPVTDRKNEETAPLRRCNRVTDKIPPSQGKKEKVLQTNLTAYTPAGDDLPLSDLWAADLEAEEREARATAQDLEGSLPL